MNVRQLYTFHLQTGGLGMGGEQFKIKQMKEKWLTLLGGSLTTHDGGTIRLAWAPKSHISSIFCILKHSTLLWYWKEIMFVIQSNVQVYYITLGQVSKNNSMLEKRSVIIQKLSTMLLFLDNTKKNQPFNLITMSLTAALHQEQLIAMISCLKKDNHLLQNKWYIRQFESSIKGCFHTRFLQRVPNSGNA